MLVQLTSEQEQKLHALAASAGLSTDSVLSQIVSAWLAEQTELAAELAAARQDLADGRVLTSEQVREHLRARARAA